MGCWAWRFGIEVGARASDGRNIDSASVNRIQSYCLSNAEGNAAGGAFVKIGKLIVNMTVRTTSAADIHAYVCGFPLNPTAAFTLIWNISVIS